MDRAGRSELVKTIEFQQEKISKYEGKLRDLILAYKGILKEKEALEASLKALSATKATPRESKAKTKESDHEKGEEAGDRNQDEKETETQEGDEPSGDKQKDGEDVETQLREQLETLTTALSTVSEEKSRLAASYQAEKKSLLHQSQEKETAFTAFREQKQNELQQMEDDIQVWKNKVRKLQQEREKEEDEHAISLKELQKLLSVERMTKEHLENQLDEARQSLLEHENVDAGISERHEQHIANLRADLQVMKDRVKTSEEKLKEPSPLLTSLQQEVAELRAKHRIDIHQEQKRAEDSEDHVQQIIKQSEERVCSLESKISELSEMVGNYDRLRYQDQCAMQKMRDRITQLDMENMALARAAHTTRGGEYDGTSEDSDVQTIIDRITKLKGLLKLANEKSEKPVDIEELLRGDASTVDGSAIHSKCQEDYQQLKEEYERYKLRAQSVLKNKSVKEPSSNKELEVTKEQLSEIKERLRSLRTDYEEQGQTIKDKEEHFRKALAALEETQKQKIQTQASEYKQKMADLEAEIRRHRDRTIALLAEKDREIQALKAHSPERLESQYASSYRRQMSSQSSDQECTHNEAGASSEDTAVTELIYRTSLGGSTTESSLLHFAQEQARKDVEINTLRRQKHSLEQALRELQQASALKQEGYIEQIENLQEEIRKLERNKSRESANLEYLKNVVYQFILCTDSIGKQQILNAISTILEFSPRERTAVFHHIAGGWWVSRAKSPKFK